MTKLNVPAHYRGLPKRVRVGNFHFVIRTIEREASEAGNFFGCTNTADQIILIGEGQSAQNLADTFIHEVLHAIHWVAALGDRDDSEEDYTTRDAHGLCRLWQDNPESMKWWVSINAMEPA